MTLDPNQVLILSTNFTTDSANTAGYYAAITFLAIAATALRFWLRKAAKAPFCIDDYFCLAAATALTIYSIISASSFESVTVSAKGITITYYAVKPEPYYFANLIFPFPITFAKLSILFLYRRLFYIHNGFMKVVYATMAICVAWWLASFLVFILICTPPSRYWDATVHGQCLNEVNVYLGTQYPNVILDFWVVIMPLWEVRTLKLALKQKIGVASIFLLSSGVGALGIYGLVAISAENSIITYDLGLDDNFRGDYLPEYSLLMDSLAVLCCSMPTYGPLFRKGLSLPWSIRSKLTSGASKSRSSAKSESHIMLESQDPREEP